MMTAASSVTTVKTHGSHTVTTTEVKKTLKVNLANPHHDRRFRRNWSKGESFKKGTKFSLWTESFTEFGKPVVREFIGLWYPADKKNTRIDNTNGLFYLIKSNLA